MKHSWRWSALVAASLIGIAASAGGGCAAQPDPVPQDEDDSAGGTGGAPAPGGAGGEGGTMLPCGTDCSLIDTPDCYVAVCNDGMHPGPIGSCVVVPDADNTPCEDGAFCTVNDSCRAGVCTGGPENDCGVQPDVCMEVTCDEGSASCSQVPLANGTACQAENLCLVGTICQNGLCTGGTPNDCFFEPVPNECHNSVCNPNTGMCEPVPGNDGAPCVDFAQLCNVGMTCATGVCQGGAPLDCSALTMGCFNGECDPTTGQCVQVPVPQGGSCLEAADDCNDGECDMNGICQPVPINEGGICDDGDACTAGTTCGSGTCGGGAPVTTCSQTQDGCCPGNCDATNDIDCACMVYQLSTPFNSNNGQSGNMFDVAALKTIEVQAMEVNFDGTATFEVWYKAGSYVGSETNQAAWTLAATATGVVSNGANVPTPLPATLSITIPAGQTYAFYVTTTGSSINYTNGTTVGAIAASNADLQIKEGIGNAYPFGSIFTPRVWNGTLIYERCGQ